MAYSNNQKGSPWRLLYYTGCTLECSFLAFTPSHLQNGVYIPWNWRCTAFCRASLFRCCHINGKFPECALQVVRAMPLKPEPHSADGHRKWSEVNETSAVTELAINVWSYIWNWPWLVKTVSNCILYLNQLKQSLTVWYCLHGFTDILLPV